MKLIAYYIGSDARWLVKTFPTDLSKIPYLLWVKIKAFLLKPLIDEYWIDNESLRRFINKFHPKAKVSIHQVPCNPGIYPKKPHDKFTVLYYYPKNYGNKKYRDWVYGIDIIERLRCNFPHFKWVRLDGTKTPQEFAEIMSTADAYLRPNRHDGSGRLIKECELNNIPYYHSQSNPNYHEIVSFLNQLSR